MRWLALANNIQAVSKVKVQFGQMASGRTLARAALLPQTRESDESLMPVLTPELVYGPT